MRVRKMVHFVCILIMAGCGPIQPSEGIITAESSPVLVSTPSLAISSISPTQVEIATPTPSSEVIDKTNLERLVLLRQWDVKSLPFYSGNKFWFSDSNQFVVPAIGSPQMFSLQSFAVDTATPLWFIQLFDYNFTINEQDQVIINHEGIVVFNKQGEKIRTIRANEQCDPLVLTSYILAIPGTSLVITGAQDSYSDLGLHGNPDRARLVMWDIENNICSDLIEQFDGVITSLSASYDGRYIGYIVVVPGVFTTRIFDLKLRKEKCEFAARYAGFTRQGQLVVYDSMDGSISVVTPEDCEVEKKFDVGTEPIYEFSQSPDGKLLAGVTDFAILFWDLQTGEKLYEIGIEKPNLGIFCFSPDGRFLVTAKRIDDLLEKDQVMLWGISEE